MRILSLFSGAGGADLAFEQAGYEIAALCEIEPHARAVLRHHWPTVPLHGDVCELDGRQYPGVDVVCGGSPCQDLSVAGKRAGMTEGSGTRSSLYYQQVRVWQESEAPYLLWENVLGALSSNAGRDFAAVLSALVGAPLAVPDDGWGGAGVASGPAGVAAWRVLDAQFFGVPQRRRRVFVLCARTGGVDPAEVLSLSESLSRHLAPGGKAGEGTADGTGGCIDKQSGGISGVAPTLKTDLAHQMGPVVAVNISNGQAQLDDVMGTLGARSGGQEVGAQTRGVVLMRQREGKPADGLVGQVVFPTLQVGDADKWGSNQWVDEGKAHVGASGIPRRLMPVECERLMGWPDRHTAHGVDESGKRYALADTARYKLCGNGIATPVLLWIARRLQETTRDLR